MNSTVYQIDLLSDAGAADSGDTAREVVPHIRVSRRARRLAVRVYPDARVEVVVPPRARPREVEAFLAAQREWIESKRAMALRNRPAPELFPPAALHLGLTGENLRLHLAGGAGRLRVVEKDGLLNISGAFTPAALKAALRRWLLAAARVRLGPRLDALAASTGVTYERLSIRRQRSRWGSCSVRGTISLNACLLFQRPEVVDYLIVHELMHVAHMNHSKRFWQAVERHCAGWRALDRDLLQGWRHVPRWIFADA